MVNRLLLLKMLHCKELNHGKPIKKPRTIIESDSSSDDDRTEPTVRVKIEQVNTDAFDDFNTCRICLKPGDIPIYGDEINNDVSEQIKSIACVQISPDDCYPKHLCDECHSVLQSAILLRKTAMETEEFLTQKDDKYESHGSPDFDENLDFGLAIRKPENHRCTLCEIDFESMQELVEHRSSTEHWDAKKTCTVCNKEYSVHYIKRHMAIHQAEAPYMCDVCGKSFLSQGHFTRHKLTHGFELPFQCSLCPYRGRFSESLKMHMRMHTGEKPYQCTDCPVRCISKSNLNRHMRIHKKQFRFRCDACGKGFYSKWELESHIKVDHTGLKEHVCNVCGKAFGYRKQMMKHQLKVHKREKLQSGRTPLYLQVERKKQEAEMHE